MGLKRTETSTSRYAPGGATITLNAFCVARWTSAWRPLGAPAISSTAHRPSIDRHPSRPGPSKSKREVGACGASVRSSACTGKLSNSKIMTMIQSRADRMRSACHRQVLPSTRSEEATRTTLGPESALLGHHERRRVQEAPQHVASEASDVVVVTLVGEAPDIGDGAGGEDGTARGGLDEDNV